MRMPFTPARSPLRASSRFPGGTFSSSSEVIESIGTSLRTATGAVEFQRRLLPVSKSALVCFSAKLLITPLHSITNPVISLALWPLCQQSVIGRPMNPANARRGLLSIGSPMWTLTAHFPQTPFACRVDAHVAPSLLLERQWNIQLSAQINDHAIPVHLDSTSLPTSAG